jgi:hypothetical protein
MKATQNTRLLCWAAAAGLALGLPERPAQATMPGLPGKMPRLGVMAPKPTTGPEELAGISVAELLKRDNSKTCAYLFGQTRMFFSRAFFAEFPLIRTAGRVRH